MWTNWAIFVICKLRLHLEGIFARDMSKFMQNLGTRMKVYPLRYIEFEATTILHKFAISLRVAAVFASVIVASRRHSSGYNLLVAPSRKQKRLATQTEAYLRNGV